MSGQDTSWWNTLPSKIRPTPRIRARARRVLWLALALSLAGAMMLSPALTGVTTVAEANASTDGSAGASHSYSRDHPTPQAGCSNCIVATVDVGAFPGGPAYDPVNDQVYVMDNYASSISVISDASDTVVGTISVPACPYMGVYDPANGYLYVSDSGCGSGDQVTVINTVDDVVVGSPIPVGTDPCGMALDPATGDLYVADYGSAAVTVISTGSDSVLGTLSVPLNPFDIAFDSTNGDLYVSDYSEGEVSVIDGATVSIVTSTITGTNPVPLAVDPANGYVFVGGTSSDTITVISPSTQSMLATFSVASPPDGLSFGGVGSDLYVMEGGSGGLAVVQPTTGDTVTTVPTGSSQTWEGGAAFDSGLDQLFVSNPNQDTVSVVALPSVGGPNPGTVNGYELSGGAVSLDPAVDYETSGFEPILNVYQTLITYNGSQAGAAPNEFVPDLATCVPGSGQCSQLYGSSLVNGYNFTFVLNPEDQFFNPASQTGFGVYPIDVAFSVARACLFSTYPGFESNPGWILCQSLLPNSAESEWQNPSTTDAPNPNWDNGWHAPLNSTPSNILSSMTLNGTYCPSVAITAGHGCVTFDTQTSGGGVWPQFLEFVADPLGASIMSCKWAAANGAGLPGWNCNAGTVAGIGSFGDEEWDSYDQGLGTCGEYCNGASWASFLQWNMLGSGPYYLESVTPGGGGGYALQANPDWGGTSCSWTGCLPATFPVQTVNVEWEASASTGEDALEAGTADYATVPSTDYSSVLLPLVEDGKVSVTQTPSLTLGQSAFDLEFQASGAQSLLPQGTTLNAPSDLFQDLALRQFLIHAFPYGTVNSTLDTVDGYSTDVLEGGAIPAGMGDFYPQNISWDEQDPTLAPANSPLSPIYWWDQVEDETGPGAIAHTACTAEDPCVFPLATIEGNPVQDAIDQEWVQNVSYYSGGAIDMVPVDEPFLQFYDGYFNGPGNNPAPVGNVGWAPDYSDPTDYVTPFYEPDQTYTGGDALAEGLSSYTGACPSEYVWATAEVTSACQGTAYDEMNDLLEEAATDGDHAQRVFLYNEAEHIAQQLGIMVSNPGQAVEQQVFASWIDPQGINTNPMVGGSGDIPFYDLSYGMDVSAFTATPNSVYAGSSTQLSVLVDGGDSPYSYSYVGLPPGCSSADTATLSCTPTSAGTYSVEVVVSDASSPPRSARAGLVLTVLEPPLAISSISASPNPVVIDTTTSLQVDATGGTTPYTYLYSGLPPGCAGADTATLSCTPTQAGVFQVSVTVVDSTTPTSQVVTGAVTLTVVPTGTETVGATGAGPHPGTVDDFELAPSGANSLDPAVDYETIGYEPILNVYQTLITYNGSDAGAAPNDFVPDLATCVPGSSQCVQLYGSSLESGSYYTFVIDPSARFYDSASGTSFGVYPNDVAFSIARTCLLSDYPGYQYNPGWILCQALLPPHGNPGWDNGWHSPLNSTPSNILNSMILNGTQCPYVALTSGNGCITFNTAFSGSYWPEFLELVADALGGSVLSCNWAAANGAGLPGWSCGAATNAEIGSFGPTAWDGYMLGYGGSSGWYPALQWSMMGSGPYYLASVTPGGGGGYTLAANPAWTGTTCSWTGCLPSDYPVRNVNVYWEITASPGESALEGRAADLASVPSTDYGTVLNPLVDSGAVTVTEAPSFTLFDSVFDLELDLSAASAIMPSGTTLNTPSDLMQDLAFRQFLVHAYPYQTVEDEVNTVDGYQLAVEEGGAIPIGMGNFYPENISWDESDPASVPASSPLSATYWWDQVESESGPGAIAKSACTTADPCEFPLVSYDDEPSFDAADQDWINEVSEYSGGAVRIVLVDLPFLLALLNTFYVPPGQSQASIGVGGWAPDYADPTDYVTPYYEPDQTYTGGAALAEGLSGYTASCPSGYEWAVASVTSACQGSAYQEMLALLEGAAGEANNAERVLLYNEAEHISQELAINLPNTGQQNEIAIASNWIDPSSINTNPMVGGSGDTQFYMLRYSLAISSFSASPTTVHVGASTTIAVAVSGGYGPYTYSYSGLPPGCVSSDTDDLLCTPSAAGTYTVTVTVTDRSDPTGSATASTSLTVKPAHLSLTSFSASVDPVHVGTSTVLMTAVSGGTTPYAFSYAGLPSGCASADTADLTCDPSTPGGYTVTVTVVDSSAPAQTTSASLSLEVLPASVQTLEITSFTASPASFVLGGSTTFAVSATGGTTPYSYSYAGLPNGCASSAASFSCTPTTLGTYPVTVTVTDDSNPARTASASVVVTVEPVQLTVTSFSASPVSVIEGNPTTLTATVAGGTSPYTYAYSGLPAGCSSQDSGTLACTPTSVGTFTVSVQVTDSSTPTMSTSASTTISVSPSTSTPLEVTSLSASPNPVVVGTSTSISVGVSGGSGTYSYSYSGLPAGCSSSNSDPLSCTPTATGSYDVTVTVTDTSDPPETASASLTLTVHPAALSVTSFTADPSPATEGSSTSLTTVVSGGNSPYTYSYAGLPSGCASGDLDPLPCTPTGVGTYTVTVTVTDASSPTQTTQSELTLEVVPSPTSTLTIVSFTATPGTVQVGDPTSIAVVASGGTGGYHYSYEGLPSPCSSSAASFSCTPTETGTYSVSVTVSDSGSPPQTASASLVLEVTPAALSITSFSASTDPVDEGSATELTTAVAGGTSPYAYAYSGLPSGCASADDATLSCTPSTTGTFTVSVTVSDSSTPARSTSSSLTLTVDPAPPPSGVEITSFSATPGTLTVGGSATIAVTATGGSGTYSYAYTGLPSPCSSTSSSFSCTPGAAGSYSITVTVTDTSEPPETAQATLTLVVHPVHLTVTSFVADPSSVEVGSSTELGASVSGGSTPYSYAYAGLPSGCASSDSEPLPCTPAAVGTFTVTLTVTDDSNPQETATASLDLTVTPSSLPPLEITSLSASPNPVVVGTSTSISVGVSGGSGTYSYSYSGLPAGCSSSNSDPLSCTPTATGSYDVTVTVTDTSDPPETATASITLQVVPTTLTIESVSADPNPATEGSATVISVESTGGNAPYSYAYAGLPSGCASQDLASISCTPGADGTFTVTVTMTDSSNPQQTASLSFELEVYPGEDPAEHSPGASFSEDPVHAPATPSDPTPSSVLARAEAGDARRRR